MKLPLLFLMIFSCGGLFAQLYISPSEKSDSYIYAKDRLVYVEKDLILERNRNKETEASIYLRKNAQLIQGLKNIRENKGNGQLSVNQKGTSNAYDYNYWGLPVTVNSPNSRLNDYVYEPLNNTSSRNANLIGGLDGSSDPLAISSKWIYTFSGSTYSNWLYAGDNFDLLPGEGFTMKGVNGTNLNNIEGDIINAGSSQIYDYRGLPNDGRIELPIKKDQILLVGNPYPSSLDLNKFLTENTSTTGIAYFWDSRQNGNSHYLADYEGGYGTYSPGTGIYIPPAFKKYSDNSETGEMGKYYERSNIPIAQGFMIIGRKDGIVGFDNSQRVYLSNNSTVPVFKSPLTGSPSMILNVEIAGTILQQLALVFREDSSPEEDHAMDAKKMDSNPEDISWAISNKNYVINVRPKKDQELIPLNIFLKTTSDLEFSATDFNNFNPDRLFIYDSMEDLYFGIKTGSLKIRLAEGEYPDRFFVSFIENIAEENPNSDPEEGNFKKPENILLNTIDIFQNNASQQLEVKILYDTGINNIRLYDLNGKLFLNRDFKFPEKEFNFPTGNLSNAVYIVKVKTDDNKELTKKVGVKN